MIKIFFVVLILSFGSFSQDKCLSAPLNLLIEASTQRVDSLEIVGLEPIIPISTTYLVEQPVPLFVGAMSNFFRNRKNVWQGKRQKEKLKGIMGPRETIMPLTNS
jgi:hypothetical protein